MSEQTRYQVLDRAPWRLTDLLLRWETILCILLGLVIVVNALGSPYFLDLYNLSDMTQNFSEKAIIALGMALLILTREIDLSVAAIVALAISRVRTYTSSLFLGLRANSSRRGPLGH